MNIKLAFGEVRGHYHLSFNPAEKEHVQSGMLIAHIWNMDAWTNKAMRALELYARDRAANREDHIGSRDLATTCNDLAYLLQDINGLKDHAADIMNNDAQMMERTMEVCHRYADLQSFLQPILWTDQPRSIMRLSEPVEPAA